MFNLDERYHSYLSGDKKLRIDGVEEKVKAYGYTDNGKEIDGYYLTTENYQLKYNMDGLFLSMKAIREVAQPVA
jgi:hypothetical protein|tara:strand:- start:110 stop:331 length:222 start_codon:yes stop_codon:yes gene_type:complete